MKTDLETEAFATDAFDLLLCCEVIEHLIANPVNLFSYMLRSLKRGGFIYLTTPNFFKAQNIRSMELRFNPQPVYPKNYSYNETFCFHVREYGMGELIDSAIQAGGSIYAYNFSACWDSPLLARSCPVYERSNLVLLVQKT
jgi:SAM-dependent methyltransferase